MFTYLQGKIATSGERGDPGALPRSNEAPAEWGGQYWDQAKLDAYIKSVNPNGDQRTVVGDEGFMQALNPLSGLTLAREGQAASMGAWVGDSYTQDSGNENAAMRMGGERGPVYKDKMGREYSTQKDAQGNYTILRMEDFQNPTGSNRDRVQPTYKLNPDGTATPTSAGTNYQPGEWVANGQAVATGVAMMVAAYFGGSWLAAYQAGAVTAPVAGAAATETGAGLLATDATGATVAQGAAGAGYGATGATEASIAAAGGGSAGGGGLGEAAQLGGEGPGLQSGMDLAADGAASGGNVVGGGSVVGGGTTAPTGSLINGISNQSLASGVASLGSAYMQSEASRNALNAQTDAANSSNALQLQMYNQTRADNAPWRAAGENALNKLTSLLNDGSLTSRFAGKLDNEAGYQFAKEEGMRAVDNSASARGGIGGAALKAGARFAEGNANQFYNDAFNRGNTENTGIYNRLSNAAGMGQQANALVGPAGQNYANQTSNTMVGLGNAQGAQAINQGNIYGNLLNQGVAFGNQNNWWQKAGG